MKKLLESPFGSELLVKCEFSLYENSEKIFLVRGDFRGGPMSASHKHAFFAALADYSLKRIRMNDGAP